MDSFNFVHANHKQMQGSHFSINNEKLRQNFYVDDILTKYRAIEESNLTVAKQNCKLQFI